MARKPRLDFPGARHHVMNRAAGKKPFLASDDVGSLFVDVLADIPVLFGARVHGYALMPNHYHLMLETPRANLSQVMQHVGARFTQSYNAMRQTDGALFRGRFKNRVVADDAYWMHLLAYVHLNPVKARLCPTPEAWLWSSHRAYIGADSVPEWLTTGELLEMFGSREALADYVFEARKHKEKAPDSFDEEHLWRQGSTGTLPPARPAPTWSEDRALSALSEATGVPADQLLERRNRGPRTAWTSWVAVWWVLRATDLNQGQLAERLGVSRTRIAQLQRQAYRARQDDTAVREIMDGLAWALDHGED